MSYIRAMQKRPLVLSVVISALVLIASAYSFAAEPLASTKEIIEVLSAYHKAKAVQLTVDKTERSEVMGTEHLNHGLIFLSSGKFRWEIEKPEKTLLVFDGKTIWNVQYPSEDFGGKTQVLRQKVSKKTQSKMLLNLLLNTNSFDQQFSSKFENEKNGCRNYILNLKEKSDLSDIKICLSKAGAPADVSKVISSIRYKDEIGNETILDLKQTKFLNETMVEKFKYSPPKDAQVSDL